jgi:hypothetical protein
MRGKLENLVHRISYMNIQPYNEYSEGTLSMTSDMQRFWNASAALALIYSTTFYRKNHETEL